MVVKVSKTEINVREKISELDKPSGVAGEAMLRAETPQEQFQLINAGRKNLLYNGAMMINQRGTQSGITSARYTLDRWLLSDGTGATFQVSQSTNVPDGFQNAILFETTTADTDLSSGTQYVNFTQKLEGQDVRQLAYGTPNAKPVTLSFWVKSSKSGQFASELEISGGVNVQPWTVNQADTWEYKTVTFEGNTSTAITTSTSTGMWVVLCWMAAGPGISGPNFQPGWRPLNQTERLPEGIPNMAGSTSNIMRFTGVQLEVGKVATPFEHRSYGEELALCQRYYEVFRQNDISGGDGFNTITTATSNGSNIYGQFTFKTVKRARPSVGVKSGTKFRAFGDGSYLNLDATEFYSPGTEATRIRVTTNGFSAGQAACLEFDGSNSSNGYIYADAEL